MKVEHPAGVHAAQPARRRLKVRAGPGRSPAGTGVLADRGLGGKGQQMLRRLNVRTRLVAVIAVPLVLLLAVAVPEVVQRRERGRGRRSGRRRRRRTSPRSPPPSTPCRASARSRPPSGPAPARTSSGPSPASARITDDRHRPGRRRPRRLAAGDPTVADGHRGRAAAARRRSTPVRQESDATDVRRAVDRPVRPDPRRPPRGPGGRRARPPPTLGVGDRLLGRRARRPIQGRRRRPGRPDGGRHHAGASSGASRPCTLSELRADEAAYRAAYLAASPPGLARRAPRPRCSQGAVTQPAAPWTT